ncbi:MAG: hypothetical protein M1828_005131 [Chrysothrix sp. TS-e1954]|nr:MAG: hypothetical protein M1828_005131 [Chrysothrix sp. TS-e1954]
MLANSFFALMPLGLAWVSVALPTAQPLPASSSEQPTEDLIPLLPILLPFDKHSKDDIKNLPETLGKRDKEDDINNLPETLSKRDKEQTEANLAPRDPQFFIINDIFDTLGFVKRDDTNNLPGTLGKRDEEQTETNLAPRDPQFFIINDIFDTLGHVRKRDENNNSVFKNINDIFDTLGYVRKRDENDESFGTLGKRDESAPTRLQLAKALLQAILLKTNHHPADKEKRDVAPRDPGDALESVVGILNIVIKDVEAGRVESALTQAQTARSMLQAIPPEN